MYFFNLTNVTNPSTITTSPRTPLKSTEIRTTWKIYCLKLIYLFQYCILFVHEIKDLRKALTSKTFITKK